MKYKNISEGRGRSFHDVVLVFFKNYMWWNLAAEVFLKSTRN